MKLTQDQIQKIENYLDIKRLTHLDLKNEVKDHMATDIENVMEEDGLGFQEAFDTAIDKWNPELADYSSFWLGWAWRGPKIMMRKCVRKIKQFYSRAFLGTIAIMALLHFTTTIFDVAQFYEVLNFALGSSYFIFFALLLFIYYKIRISGYDTSYRYLFKVLAVGFSSMYLSFNPIWYDSIQILERNENYLWVLGLHSFLVSFAYTFWALYKSHRKSEKWAIL